MTRRILIFSMAVLAILLFFSFSGCKSGYDQDGDYEILEFTSISRGPDSSVTEERQLVIRDQDKLEQMWQNINAVRGLPEVDFTREMVIAVFMGERPTGGYAVEITSIYEYEDRLVVNVRETEPGPDEMVTQALTYPYQAVIVKDVDKKVIFNITQ